MSFRGLVLAVIAVWLSVVALGCTSAQVSVSPMAADLSSKAIAVIDVSEKKAEGLQWTILVAGEVYNGIGAETTRGLETELMQLGGTLQ